jgi:hypothetical protein
LYASIWSCSGTNSLEEEDWRETEEEEEDDMAEGEEGFLVPVARAEEGDEEG